MPFQITKIGFNFTIRTRIRIFRFKLCLTLPPSLRIRSSHTASSFPPSLSPHLNLNFKNTLISNYIHTSERLVYIICICIIYYIIAAVPAHRTLNVQDHHIHPNAEPISYMYINLSIYRIYIITECHSCLTCLPDPAPCQPVPAPTDAPLAPQRQKRRTKEGKWLVSRMQTLPSHPTTHRETKHSKHHQIDQKQTSHGQTARLT